MQATDCSGSPRRFLFRSSVAVENAQQSMNFVLGKILIELLAQGYFLS